MEEGHQTVNVLGPRARNRGETGRETYLERQFRTQTMNGKFSQKVPLYSMTHICPVAMKGQVPSVRY